MLTLRNNRAFETQYFPSKDTFLSKNSLLSKSTSDEYTDKSVLSGGNYFSDNRRMPKLCSNVNVASHVLHWNGSFPVWLDIMTHHRWAIYHMEFILPICVVFERNSCKLYMVNGIVITRYLSRKYQKPKSYYTVFCKGSTPQFGSYEAIEIIWI